MSQSREHLLLACPKVIEFRTKVFAKFDLLFKDKAICNKFVLFGCLNMTRTLKETSEACDLIVMLMNRHVYYNNFHENNLAIEGFANEVRSMERIEYTIAERKGKLGFHLAKWESIGDSLGYSILETHVNQGALVDLPPITHSA